MTALIRPLIVLDDDKVSQHPLNALAQPFVFQPFMDGDSLFQDTLERVSGVECSAPLVIAPKGLHDEVCDQMDMIAFECEDLWVSQDGLDIERAINWMENRDPEGVLLVCPVAHFIADQIAFSRALEDALSAALNGYLVRFGVIADFAMAGREYFEVGHRLDAGYSGHQIAQTFDRPNSEDLMRHLDAGRTVLSTDLVCALPSVLKQWHETKATPDKHAVVSILSAWSDLNTWPGIWKALSLLEE